MARCATSGAPFCATNLAKASLPYATLHSAH
eukprot:CAMPEP_0182507670 /NCGR_PEP_ID=MMETSP1321-20130603/23591_1 /TAXON_ID=91990 /ORGANISM="Bolidomonas sp., Strain RCC1657" /LENGTH=30 /DNA_ID= /DNA_START= /DNA_END= /DNA_ORIENTATION=